MNLLASILALIAGCAIGFGFGLVQEAGRRKNEKLELAGKLKSGWSIMPGSGKRVAFLLLALALVQIACPLLFQGNTKWWVSGGVVIGYGGILIRQLTQRRRPGS